MQPLGEDRGFVRFAIAIGVFENEQLVIGPRAAGEIVRVGRHRRDPQPALVVEGHLHRLLQRRQILLRREALDLVAIGQLECFQRLVRRQIRDRLVEIRLHLRQWARLFVGDFVHQRPARGYVPDPLIAQPRHLPRFLDLLRVVHIPVRIPALSVHMHAIHDPVVAVPHPRLVIHRRAQLLRIGFGNRRALSVDGIHQRRRDDRIAGLREMAAIDRRLRFRLLHRRALEPVFRQREKIHRPDFLRLRHVEHRLRVSGQPLVFFHAGRQIVIRRAILKRDGRHENQPRSRLPVVGHGQRVIHKGA